MENSFKDSKYSIPIEKKSFSDFLNEKIDKIICPQCGSDVRCGKKFYIFMDNCSLSCSAIVPQIARGTDSRLVIGGVAVASGEIKAIKCLECGLSGKEIFFGKEEEQKRTYFLGKVINISNKWTTILSKTKTFFVLSECLTRGLENKDSCLISGISFNEIENNQSIDSNDIVVRKKNG